MLIKIYHLLDNGINNRTAFCYVKEIKLDHTPVLGNELVIEDEQLSGIITKRSYDNEYEYIIVHNSYKNHKDRTEIIKHKEANGWKKVNIVKKKVV